jgi:hypothetical protein
LIKNCNLPKLQEKPSVLIGLLKEHPALKLKFSNIFLCSWVIFALLDPDPACEFAYGSRKPTESGSTALRISKNYYLGDIPHSCGLHNVPDDELLDRLVLGASLQQNKNNFYSRILTFHCRCGAKKSKKLH